MKRILVAFTFLLVVVSPNATAQNLGKVWEKLHNNERKEALTMVNQKGFVKDLETAFAKQIVRMENGQMTRDSAFLKSLSQYPDFEYYLYAHWTLSYIFEDYLQQGFSENNIASIQLFEKSALKNHSLKDNYQYYESVVERFDGNWDSYEKLSSEIVSIKDWEYVGPFENLNNSGMDTAYPPEAISDPSVDFDTERIGMVNWYQPANSPEPYMFFLNHKELLSGINYAQTFVNSPIDQRVYLRFGRGGLFQLSLNDVVILEDDKDRQTEMDAYTVAVNLQKGVNRILVKIASGGFPYFVLKIEDAEGHPIDTLSVNLNERNYTKATKASLNIEKLNNPFYAYFEDRIAQGQGDENLNQFSLVMAYFRNAAYEDAKRVCENWLKNYPNSTFIKSILGQIYGGLGDTESQEEVNKNIETFDPDYYLSLLNKFEDFQELYKMDIDAYESTLDKLSNTVDYTFLKKATEMLKHLRRNKVKEMEMSLDELISDPSMPSSIFNVFVTFYSQIFNNDAKTIEKIEARKKNYFDYELDLNLSYYYEKQNRKQEALDNLRPNIDRMPYDNSVLHEYILYLHDYQRYEESLPYIEMCLKNYPNSFTFLKLKGEVYHQLDKTEKALGYFEKALEKKPSDKDLRKKVYDLKKIKDPLDTYRTTEFYDYIAENRGKATESNYGVNVLLDQVDIEKYSSSGGRYKASYVYEVTSQEGIDNLKEYNLGIYGDYVVYKSEIVKADKSIVPADRSGSNFVFNGLGIGDVILIDFEATFSNSGRFHKYYTDIRTFDSYYPTTKRVYRLYTPEDEVVFKVVNGEVPHKKFKKGAFTVNEWVVEQQKALPIVEDFMPTFADIARKLHISTIPSWSDISNWYSDLVREQMEYDDTVENAFQGIFPNGVDGMTDDEKAKKIYQYITSNFSYSYVSFKQSGFVPQKPGKTIRTSLGDCKDFSTLFLVLGKKAGLDVHLVLILTSDYGEKSLVLPSTDFNHCIVKVGIDGKPQYLELTDKYLPYKSLPVSLRNATALDIPFNKGDLSETQLYKLNDAHRKEGLVMNEYKMYVGEDTPKIDLTTTFTGHLSSYYIGQREEKTDTSLKEELAKNLNDRTNVHVNLEKVKEYQIDKENAKVSISQEVSFLEKINTIGSIKTFELPVFSYPYNQSIISLQERKYPIFYIDYETADAYVDSFEITIEEGNEFIEVPKDASFSFREFSYQVRYELAAENQLRIQVNAKMDSKNILPEEYPEYKAFVKKVLDSRKQFIAFKKKA